MRRNLILLNLLLAALLGVVCWQLWAGYEETLRREKAFLSAPAPAVPPPVVALPPPPAQVSAVVYYEIASKLPFSKDRNPNVVVEEAPPKPMPTLPRYYGMMNFGESPRVVLAAKQGAPQKSYAAGDVIGEFKLVAITEPGLVFEWDGKQVPAGYDEIRGKDSPPQAATDKSSAPSASEGSAPGVKALSQPVSSVSSAESGKPGADTGASYKGCQAGDSSPAGTVVDGYRKMMTETPFGRSCRWEKVQ